MTNQDRDIQWRADEREIEGGYCGCEYPRLWPPRRRSETTREELPADMEPEKTNA